MIPKGPEIRVSKCNFRSGAPLAVFIEEIRKDKVYGLVSPLTFERREELFTETQPTVTLSTVAAQQLIDDLWECGLRPSEGSGSAGALTAVQRHLEDMRTLVFKKEKTDE